MSNKANTAIECIEIDVPKTAKKRVVIVGGGFAGMNLAQRIDPRYFQTILLDKNNFHTFQPLLYQVATAGLEPDAICSPLRKTLDSRKDFHYRMVAVNSVDTASRRVCTSAGFLSYDYLVIASGAVTSFFGIHDFESRAFPLKEVADSVKLRNHIFEMMEEAELEQDEKRRKALMTFIIVGGGPTGVEVTGALAELKKHVLYKDYPDLNIDEMTIYLVEGMNRLLIGMSDIAGRKALEYLEKMGAVVRLNTRSTHYEGHVLSLEDGTEINTHTVVWAAGVVANPIGGFDQASLEKRRLAVNAYSQVRTEAPSVYFENIFALGDVSLMRISGYPDGLPGMAPVAIQQGRLLAKNLKRHVLEKRLIPFAYRDKGTMATIGRNRAVADMRHQITIAGFPGWVIWMVVHLWYLIGFRNKAIVLIDWTWNYFTYDRGVRTIIHLADKPDVPS